MSRGPIIYDAAISIRLLKDQKEQIRKAGTRVGLNIGLFVRTVLLKEAARINKAA